MDETSQGGVQETGEQKFVRLATKRTQAALGKVKLIGNLSSSSYRYTPEQAAKIIATLRHAVDQLESKFNKVRGAKSADTSFSL